MSKSDFLLRSRYFLRTLRSGSIGRAADSLGMGAPQLSREMAKLERETGSTLLIRSSSGVSATREGAAFAEWIEPLIGKLDEVEESVRAGATGESTLWIPGWLEAELFPAWLAGFRKVHPEARIVSREIVPGAPASRSAFSYRIAEERLPSDEGMIAVRIAEVPIVNAASPDYLAKAGDVLEPEGLGLHELIVTDAVERPLVLRNLKSGEFRGVDLERATVSGSFITVRNQIRSAAGIAAGIPRFLIERELKRGELVEVLPEWRAEPEVLWFMRPPSRYPSLLGLQLPAWFREQAKRTPGLIAG